MLSLLAAILAVIAAETALRVLASGAELSPAVFERSEGASAYRLLAGAKVRVRQFGREVDIEISARGARTSVQGKLQPRLVDTPAARLPSRIHLIGDSQVFGWGLSNDETIGSALAVAIGGSVEVVNHGIPGYGPLDYVAVMSRIPPADLAIVVHTEENDEWDAFGIFRSVNVRCGYLVSRAVGGFLPCGVMRSRLVQAVFEAYDAFIHRLRPTPLGFSEGSSVASRVLAYRIRNAYSEQIQPRAGNVVFATVPWKGRFSSEWRARYSPAPAAGVEGAASLFVDDSGMLEHFRRHPDPESLFIEGDSHLSAAGARHWATRVAGLIRDREQSASPELLASSSPEGRDAR